MFTNIEEMFKESDAFTEELEEDLLDDEEDDEELDSEVEETKLCH
jgi:hypothetical protein